MCKEPPRLKINPTKMLILVTHVFYIRVQNPVYIIPDH